MESLKIVLGLGNPGTRYRSTRHNVGFEVVELLAKRWAASFRLDAEIRGKAWVAEASAEFGRFVLAKPRTYMNRSGRAAVALCSEYEVAAERILVVYDDADLALGRLRIRERGGPGGHNGMRSLIDALGTQEFARVRLGVRGEGRGEEELSDYVLGSFDAEERPVVDELVELAADAVEEVLRTDLATAMNGYNGRSVVPPGREDIETETETEIEEEDERFPPPVGGKS